MRACSVGSWASDPGDRPVAGFPSACPATLNPGQRERIAWRSALHRMAGVGDIAEAAALLLGDPSCPPDRAKNITDTVMTVDAGNTV
jgi:hypothetical protein